MFIDSKHRLLTGQELTVHCSCRELSSKSNLPRNGLLPGLHSSLLDVQIYSVFDMGPICMWVLHNNPSSLTN